MAGSRQRSPLSRLLVTGSVAAVVIVADQLTKSWAVRRLPDRPIHVIGPLDLVITVNRGSAFGLVQGSAPVVAGLAVVLVAVLLVAAGRARSTTASVALGLLVGGALGNLFDRAFRGYHGGVVDFIDLHHWPTFNVADSCITVGGILLALTLWRAGPDPGHAHGGGGGDPSHAHEAGGGDPGHVHEAGDASGARVTSSPEADEAGRDAHPPPAGAGPEP